MADFNISKILKNYLVKDTERYNSKNSSDAGNQNSIINDFNTSNNNIDIEQLEQDFAETQAEFFKIVGEHESKEENLQSQINDAQSNKDTLSTNINQRNNNISDLNAQKTAKESALSELGDGPNKEDYRVVEYDENGSATSFIINDYNILIDAIIKQVVKENLAKF